MRSNAERHGRTAAAGLAMDRQDARTARQLTRPAANGVEESISHDVQRGIKTVLLDPPEAVASAPPPESNATAPPPQEAFHEVPRDPGPQRRVDNRSTLFSINCLLPVSVGWTHGDEDHFSSGCTATRMKSLSCGGGDVA